MQNCKNALVFLKKVTLIEFSHANATSHFQWSWQWIHMSDDLNLGWLIHYVSGHRMPKPCKAIGNLKIDTLSLIHHMMLWIVIWICWISITGAPPKYYHVLLLSSKYSKRSHKVLQRITSSHYQELQRTDLMQPATCFSQIRCPSER